VDAGVLARTALAAAAGRRSTDARRALQLERIRRCPRRLIRRDVREFEALHVTAEGP
jgi:hypothetical protein